jgi:hypothetical protein
LHRQSKNIKHVAIKLADSLGSVAIDLPARYDTFFTWTNHSDCGAPCNKIEYRYQPKSLHVTKESGFLWLDEQKDSIERFTIVHSGYLEFSEKDDSLAILLYHNFLTESVVNDPRTSKIKSDTLEKINDRFFSIITFDDYDTGNNQHFKKLLSTTFIHGNIVSFSYELLTKQKDSLADIFLQNAKESLRTLQIVK